MKLWTIQAQTLLDAARNRVLVADWERTPQNWRFAYRWMASQWKSRIGVTEINVPLWCWHSCNGVDGSAPTVGTLASLMGDWNYYATYMLVLELSVPDDLVLLSSYWRWNEAMNDAIDRRSEQIDTPRFIDMFDPPLIKHDADDVQGVMPAIDYSWITDMRALPSGDVSELDWDLPFADFPKMPEL